MCPGSGPAVDSRKPKEREALGVTAAGAGVEVAGRSLWSSPNLRSPVPRGSPVAVAEETLVSPPPGLKKRLGGKMKQELEQENGRDVELFDGGRGGEVVAHLHRRDRGPPSPATVTEKNHTPPPTRSVSGRREQTQGIKAGDLSGMKA